MNVGPSFCTNRYAASASRIVVRIVGVAAGTYRLFLDFRHGDAVHTAAFTVQATGTAADEPGAVKPAGAVGAEPGPTGPKPGVPDDGTADDGGARAPEAYARTAGFALALAGMPLAHHEPDGRHPVVAQVWRDGPRQACLAAFLKVITEHSQPDVTSVSAA